MRSSWLIFIFSMMAVPLSSLAQTEIDQIVERVVEFMAERYDEEQDYSELAERLAHYNRHRLDLNSVTADQLAELMFISAIQAGNLVRHRDESGKFIDVLEVQTVRGFDTETAALLANFVIVRIGLLMGDIDASQLIRKSTHDILIRTATLVERQAGFSRTDSRNAAYAGSALKILARYRYNFDNRIRLGITTKKDAGEPFFRRPVSGFDFYSAHLSLSGRGTVEKLVIGDYSLQFGQGLSLWSGLSFGKGAALTNLTKPDIGLRPYTSANESMFLRGVAAVIRRGALQITPFISHRNVDASLADDQKSIKSLPQSGLHRTDSEIKGKGAASQTVYGFNTQLRKDGLRFGSTFHAVEFNKPLIRGEEPYKRYDFAGNRLLNVSADYSYSLRNSYLFGEWAHSISSGFASVHGVLSSISNHVSLALLYRDYQRNYHSFFSQAVAESSGIINEKGFFLGSTFKFSRELEMSLYYDLFSFPWLRYRVDAPSAGSEHFIQMNYAFNKRLKITARYKSQQKDENYSSLDKKEGIVPVIRKNFRLEVNYRLNERFSLRSRFETVSYLKSGSTRETGSVGYQDVIYDPPKSRLSGNIRLASFDTDGFNSRVYGYENDVLYGYSIPAYQDRGMRFYINTRLNLRKGLDIWARYAATYFSGTENIGSGNDMIDGSRKSDIRLQIRYQF